MFDKVKFTAKIDFEKEAPYLAERNGLQRCTSGNTIFYESSQKANIEGITITITKDKIQMTCSLHKQYYKKFHNKLDNSGFFSMDMARKSLDVFFEKVGIEKKRAKVTYYEVGLNIITDHNPIAYIEKMKSIITSTGKGSERKREMFIDAHFERDRQKTTTKTKHTKKVFKPYDKGHETQDRTRTAYTGNYILRIETMYRRQSIPVINLFSKKKTDKLEQTFYKDWKSVEFSRILTADKGVRQSEKVKAEKLLLLGREKYLERAKADFEREILTVNEYRTIREFIRDWEDNKHKYKRLPSELEKEYKEKLLQAEKQTND